jgi:hypothetical protein
MTDLPATTRFNEEEITDQEDCLNLALHMRDELLSHIAELEAALKTAAGIIAKEVEMRQQAEAALKTMTAQHDEQYDLWLAAEQGKTMAEGLAADFERLYETVFEHRNKAEAALVERDIALRDADVLLKDADDKLAEREWMLKWAIHERGSVVFRSWSDDQYREYLKAHYESDVLADLRARAEEGSK